MALTKTTAQIQAEIRERGEVRSVWISDANLLIMINGSLCELYDLLVSVNQDYYLDSDDNSVVSGTATYALPTDFYKSLGVDLYDSGRWNPLRRFNFADRNKYQSGGSGKLETGYRIMGSNIRLYPTPGWSGTNDLRLWYIPAPTLLSGATDTFDGILGWEEYIIVDCLIKAKVKSEEDISEVAAQKNALIKRIKSMAEDRDNGEPDRIRDVESENSCILYNNGF